MNQCALLTIWTSLFTSALILQYLESVCSYFTVLWISLLYWPYEHHSYPVTSWAGWTPWCLYDVPSTKKSNTSAYMQFALKLIERQSIEISQNCFTRQGKKANFDQNQNVKRYLVTFFLYPKLFEQKLSILQTLKIFPSTFTSSSIPVSSPCITKIIIFTLQQFQLRKALKWHTYMLL